MLDNQAWHERSRLHVDSAFEIPVRKISSRPRTDQSFLSIVRQKNCNLALAFLFTFFSVLLHSTSAFAVDTTPYSNILRRFVHSNGLVDYAGLKKSPQDLKRFIGLLAEEDREKLERSSDQEQIAFWLNAYNAVALRIIIDRYPIKAPKPPVAAFPLNSIRQIPGVWDRPSYSIAGRSVTLNDIEHKILRAQFGDPRIHMAIVSGALSGPALRREPYDGKQLDAQLDDQVQKFLEDQDHLAIDKEMHAVSVSAIFQWYAKDFRKWNEENFNVGSEEDSILQFLAKYRPEQSEFFLSRPAPKLEYHSFDWTLNVDSASNSE